MKGNHDYNMSAAKPHHQKQKIEGAHLDINQRVALSQEDIQKKH